MFKKFFPSKHVGRRQIRKTSLLAAIILLLALTILISGDLPAVHARPAVPASDLQALPPAPESDPGPLISPINPDLSALMALSPDQAVCGNASWVNPAGSPNPSYSISVNLKKGTNSKIEYTPLGKLDFGGGNIAYAFCTDIYHHRAYNRSFCLDGGFFSDWRVAWLVTNYPPTINDAVQQAARQAAVWRYTDGWELNQLDATIYNSTWDTAVKNAYNAILAAMPATPPAEYQPGNVQIVIEPHSSTNFLPYQPAHPFIVRLTKGGAPLAGYKVTVAATHGALDKTSAVTDANGEAAFTLTSTTPGQASITASASLDLPAGSRFVDELSPDTWQRLVLGQVTRVTVQAEATKDWVESENMIIAHKFEDKNFNGVQEEDEPNLAGWVFTLTTPGGQFSGTTDGNGNAFFEGKIGANGSYTLAETLQSGWSNSTPLSQSRRRSAGDAWLNWRADFGNARNSVLEVLKYLDSDGDQVWDQGQEPPLSGWQFALYFWNGDDWAQYQGGTSDGNGSVGFTNLPAGRYKAVELMDNHAGYTNTTALEQEVTLGTNDLRELRFGNRGALSIRGHKFSDLDADGGRAAGEPTLSGWTMRLTGGPHAIDITATTDSGGEFRFEHLEPGTYTLSESGKTGWAQTFPGGSGTHTVTLTAQNVTGVDFGNTELASIGDYVWLDYNRNGIQEGNEQPIPGVPVELFKMIGSSWVSEGVTNTDGNGFYLFDNLMAGKYYVKFTAPSGYIITAKDQGGDDAKDSDADPTSGGTTTIILNAGEHQRQWDAGLYQPPAIDIGKYVSVDNQTTWHDADDPAGPNTTSGSAVYFRFVITNIGLVPLNNVTLSDNVYAVNGCPAIPDPMQPGASYTCIIGPLTALVGQHTNTATTTGQYQNITVSDSDDANYYAPPEPAIDVEKYVSVDNQLTWHDADTAPGPQAALGDSVYFRFVITNVGNVPLSNPALSDDVYTVNGCFIPNPLNPGQSHTCYHGPTAAELGQHTNTATATGQYDGVTLNDTDPAHYHVPSEPAIDVEKYVSVDGQTSWQDADSPTGPQTAVGNSVYFRFVITNIGNVPLSNVTLSDSIYSVAGCPAIPNPLVAGGSYACTIGPIAAQAGQHTNTGATSGQYGNTTVRDQDDATYAALTKPAIDIEKLVSVDGQATWQDADAAPGPQANAGAGVHFRFVITNIGNVPLNNPTLSDTIYSVAGCPALPNPLAAGASYICTIGPLAAQLGQHTNTATTTGQYQGITVNDADDANYFAPSAPDIDIEKYVSVDNQATWHDADIAPGLQTRVDERVFYRLVVTNTGNVPLSNVAVNDSLHSLAGCGPIPNPLQPGASYACVYDTIVVDSQQNCVYTNTASVTGLYNNIAVGDADDANYYAPSRPAIDVEKLVSVDGQNTWHDADAAPGPETMAGNDVYFKFIVVNTGNVPLNNVTLTDNVYSLSSCAAIANPLALGGSYTCTIGPIPAQAEQHSNTAAVSGHYGGLILQDQDAANYIAMTADASIGDTVWHDLDLDGIQDAGEPGINGVIIELLDGGNVIDTAVTIGGGHYFFANLPAGNYQVRVAASNFDPFRPLRGFAFTSAAYGPNPYPVSLNPSQHFLFADFGYARAGVSIIKRASAPQVLRGGNVTYTYQVSNSGDTWLSDLNVSDDVLGQICGPTEIGLLGPGQTGWCQRTVSLASNICNVAAVTAQAVTATGDPLQLTVQATSSQVCVEAVDALRLDYGDAPDSGMGSGPGDYQTTAGDHGPSHVIIPNLHLGRQAPDADNGFGQDPDADADDITYSDDEDGVSILPVITTASGAVNLMMSAVNATGAPATLACWLDFNRDGDFNDTGERSAATVNSGAGRQSVYLTFSGFPVPTPGPSILRCRIANNAAEVAAPTGPANSGEVEDTWVTIINVGGCQLASTVSAQSTADICSQVSISGMTWLDSNRDGKYVNEAMVNDITLTITNIQQERVAIVTTGPGSFQAGQYLVQDLPPGVYYVTMDSWPTGYRPANPLMQKIVLNNNGETGVLDFPIEEDALLYLPTIIR